jgi:hypothetical protein
MKKEPIKALIIVEMIGRPKEHLEETLKEYVKKICSEKGVRLVNEKVHEPKKIERKKEDKGEADNKKETKIEAELFSTFAEIEFEADDINVLMRIVVFYMPSHIEILSPDRLELENLDLNGFFNEVIRKMHDYDSITKSIIMENKMMKEKFQQIINNIRKPVLKTEEDTIKEETKEKEESAEKSNIKPKKQKNKKD